MYIKDTEIPFSDKVAAVTSYYTFGMTGIIWLIAVIIVFKKHAGKFCSYHIYQSVFLSIVLYILSLLFSIAYSFAADLPIVGKIFRFVDVFLFKTPNYATFTLFNLFLFMLLTYLSIGALLGKYSYLPFISRIVKANFEE